MLSEVEQKPVTAKRVFVAGGTGVLGRAAVRALVEEGHRVRATARGEEKIAMLRALGAEPVEVDLFERSSLRRAMAGCDVAIRLATKIPRTRRMRSPSAWAENNRLRTVTARLMVEAAMLEGVPVYVHESVAFVYADGGGNWLDEESPTDDAGTGDLQATLLGEREAHLITKAGGTGVVLRFGGFFGSDAPNTLEMMDRVRRGRFPLLGAGRNYFSPIYVPDAGRAVAAAIDAPAGTYNVNDDEPLPQADYLEALVHALHAPPPRHLSALLGRWTLGRVWRYLSRSLRVSNLRFRQATGWSPVVRSVREGWLLVASGSCEDRINPAPDARSAGAV